MLSPLFPSCHSFPTVLHCGFRTGERPGLSLDGGVNAVCQLKVPTPMFRVSVSIDTSPHGCPSVGCSLLEPPVAVSVCFMNAWCGIFRKSSPFLCVSPQEMPTAFSLVVDDVIIYRVLLC